MSSPNPHSLGEFLGRALGSDVVVTDMTPVTAGARRLNVLFDALVDGYEQAFVITQLPNVGEAFRDIGTEVDWLRLAEKHGSRVPHVVASAPDGDELGGPFFITRRVEGVSIPKHVVELCAAQDGLGSQVAFEIGEAMARIHAIPLDEVPNDAEAPDGTAIDGAFAWIDEKMGELLQPSPAFMLVAKWLERNAPAPAQLTPIHGDVRNGNILVNSSGLGALLDWETAHVGEPFEDLGWLAQRMWRARNDALEIGGFGNRSDVRAGYQAAGGTWDDERFHWWKVYRTLWWGLSLANQSRQHLDDTFRSIVMAASGRRVAELEWDALCLIRPAGR